MKNKIHYINYGDDNFYLQKKVSTIMAKLTGDFNSVRSFSPSDLDIDFLEQNKIILSNKRGGGFWLWKPYIILKALLDLDDGDFLFYSDSGAAFVKSIKSITKYTKLVDQDVIGFELPLIEKQWTKHEVFEAMSCNCDEIRNSPQIMATFVLINVLHPKKARVQDEIKVDNPYSAYKDKPFIIFFSNYIGKII